MMLITVFAMTLILMMVLLLALGITTKKYLASYSLHNGAITVVVIGLCFLFIVLI